MSRRDNKKGSNYPKGIKIDGYNTTILRAFISGNRYMDI